MHRKLELPGRLAGPMAVEEILQGGRHLAPVRAALPQFLGHLLGDVPRPAFAGIEAHDPDRAAVLPIHQLAQQGLKVGAVLVGLPPGGPTLAAAGGPAYSLMCAAVSARSPSRSSPGGKLLCLRASLSFFNQPLAHRFVLFEPEARFMTGSP